MSIIIPDNEFIRSKVPMTKEEVRTISISKLNLKENDVLLDIGAGTGSVAIQASFQLNKGKVFAIERKSEAAELIRTNIDKFQTNNVKVIEGLAPAALKGISGFNKVFIGGSAGNIQEIIKWCKDNAESDIKIVINAIVYDTLTKGVEALENNGFKNIEIMQMSISKFENIANHRMLKPQTPVFIITAS